MTVKKKSTPLPSQSILKELLEYDPATGKFTWRWRKSKYFASSKRPAEEAQTNWNSRWAGKPAFVTARKSGHFVGDIFGVQYPASRIAYKIHHGTEPDNIYFANGIKSDTSILNLVTSWNEVSESVRLEDTNKRKILAQQASLRAKAKAETDRIAAIDRAVKKAEAEAVPTVRIERQGNWNVNFEKMKETA